MYYGIRFNQSTVFIKIHLYLVIMPDFLKVNAEDDHWLTSGYLARFDVLGSIYRRP